MKRDIIAVSQGIVMASGNWSPHGRGKDYSGKLDLRASYVMLPSERSLLVSAES